MNQTLVSVTVVRSLLFSALLELTCPVNVPSPGARAQLTLARHSGPDDDIPPETIQCKYSIARLYLRSILTRPVSSSCTTTSYRDSLSLGCSPPRVSGSSSCTGSRYFLILGSDHTPQALGLPPRTQEKPSAASSSRSRRSPASKSSSSAPTAAASSSTRTLMRCYARTAPRAL